MLDIDLPVHPFTGMTALAVLGSGRVVWPVLGGAPDDEADEDTGTDEDGQDDAGDDEGQQDEAAGDDQDDDGDEDKPLGPKGERALAAMKEKLKAERAKRRAAEAKLTENGKPADTDKPDPEAAATARANARILRSEIKAAAAGKLADPKDALRFLDLDSFEVDADGEVDEDEVAEAIDDLLKKKPYLAAAAQGGRRRFEGGGDGGARKGAAKPITEEQLSKMTPAQIEKALDEGKLAHLL
jgi:hypothetical protein